MSHAAARTWCWRNDDCKSWRMRTRGAWGRRILIFKLPGIEFHCFPMHPSLRTICLTLIGALFLANSSSGEDLKKIAAAIDGYRYEFPCKDPMPENPKPGADGVSARDP